MIFELRRIEGDVIGRIGWSSKTVSLNDIQERAKSTLMDCYEWDDRSFWPKSKYEFGRPENIVAISDANEIVTSYTIYDMVADTRRYLTNRTRSKI